MSPKNRNRLRAMQCESLEERRFLEGTPVAAAVSEIQPEADPPVAAPEARETAVAAGEVVEASQTSEQTVPDSTESSAEQPVEAATTSTGEESLKAEPVSEQFVPEQSTEDSSSAPSLGDGATKVPSSLELEQDPTRPSPNEETAEETSTPDPEAIPSSSANETSDVPNSQDSETSTVSSQDMGPASKSTSSTATEDATTDDIVEPVPKSLTQGENADESRDASQVVSDKQLNGRPDENSPDSSGSKENLEPRSDLLASSNSADTNVAANETPEVITPTPEAQAEEPAAGLQTQGLTSSLLRAEGLSDQSTVLPVDAATMEQNDSVDTEDVVQASNPVLTSDLSRSSPIQLSTFAASQGTSGATGATGATGAESAIQPSTIVSNTENNPNGQANLAAQVDDDDYQGEDDDSGDAKNVEAGRPATKTGEQSPASSGTSGASGVAAEKASLNALNRSNGVAVQLPSGSAEASSENSTGENATNMEESTSPDAGIANGPTSLVDTANSTGSTLAAVGEPSVALDNTDDRPQLDNSTGPAPQTNSGSFASSTLAQLIATASVQTESGSVMGQGNTVSPVEAKVDASTESRVSLVGEADDELEGEFEPPKPGGIIGDVNEAVELPDFRTASLGQAEPDTFPSFASAKTLPSDGVIASTEVDDQQLIVTEGDQAPEFTAASAGIADTNSEKTIATQDTSNDASKGEPLSVNEVPVAGGSLSVSDASLGVPFVPGTGAAALTEIATTHANTVTPENATSEEPHDANQQVGVTAVNAASNESTPTLTLENAQPASGEAVNGNAVSLGVSTGLTTLAGLVDQTLGVVSENLGSSEPTNPINMAGSHELSSDVTFSYAAQLASTSPTALEASGQAAFEVEVGGGSDSQTIGVELKGSVEIALPESSLGSLGSLGNSQTALPMRKENAKQGSEPLPAFSAASQISPSASGDAEPAQASNLGARSTPDAEVNSTEVRISDSGIVASADLVFSSRPEATAGNLSTGVATAPAGPQTESDEFGIQLLVSLEFDSSVFDALEELGEILTLNNNVERDVPQSQGTTDTPAISDTLPQATTTPEIETPVPVLNSAESISASASGLSTAPSSAASAAVTDAALVKETNEVVSDFVDSPAQASTPGLAANDGGTTISAEATTFNTSLEDSDSLSPLVDSPSSPSSNGFSDPVNPMEPIVAPIAQVATAAQAATEAANSERVSETRTGANLHLPTDAVQGTDASQVGTEAPATQGATPSDGKKQIALNSGIEQTTPATGQAAQVGQLDDVGQVNELGATLPRKDISVVSLVSQGDASENAAHEASLGVEDSAKSAAEIPAKQPAVSEVENQKISQLRTVDEGEQATGLPRPDSSPSLTPVSVQNASEQAAALGNPLLSDPKDDTVDPSGNLLADTSDGLIGSKVTNASANNVVDAQSQLARQTRTEAMSDLQVEAATKQVTSTTDQIPDSDFAKSTQDLDSQGSIGNPSPSRSSLDPKATEAGIKLQDEDFANPRLVAATESALPRSVRSLDADHDARIDDEELAAYASGMWRERLITELYEMPTSESTEACVDEAFAEELELDRTDDVAIEFGEIDLASKNNFYSSLWVLNSASETVQESVSEFVVQKSALAKTKNKLSVPISVLIGDETRSTTSQEEKPLVVERHQLEKIQRIVQHQTVEKEPSETKSSVPDAAIVEQRVTEVREQHRKSGVSSLRTALGLFFTASWLKKRKNTPSEECASDEPDKNAPDENATE